MGLDHPGSQPFSSTYIHTNNSIVSTSIICDFINGSSIVEEYKFSGRKD